MIASPCRSLGSRGSPSPISHRDVIGHADARRLKRSLKAQAKDIRRVLGRHGPETPNRLAVAPVQARRSMNAVNSADPAPDDIVIGGEQYGILVGATVQM